MADMDDEVVAAITFGLTYFYYKMKQSSLLPYTTKQSKMKRRKQRRFWTTENHKNRKSYLAAKFHELLYEPSGEFHSFCRMTYSDFEYLLDKISPMITKQDTPFREAIPAKYRLAITLRFLSSGDSFKTLHNLFRVSTSTISNIIPEVCKSINKVLKDEIKMPSTADSWINIEKEYRNIFPHCLGSIDVKNIRIANQLHNGTDNFNHEEKKYIALLSVVDANYKFIYADIGYQGSKYDDAVFNNSLLWKKICTNEAGFPTPCPLPGSDVNVPYIFIGDGALSQSTHVMNPYPEEHAIGEKKIFNQSLSRARVVVENTFGILNTVFGVFRHPIDLNPSTVPDITMTCLLIHNYLTEKSPESYTAPGTFDEIDMKGNLVTPGSWRRNENDTSAIRNMPIIPRSSPMHAQQIREEFTSYFSRSSRLLTIGKYIYKQTKVT